jgi:hypothetical protein
MGCDKIAGENIIDFTVSRVLFRCQNLMQDRFRKSRFALKLEPPMRPLILALTLLTSTAQAQQWITNPAAHAQNQFAQLQSGAAYPYYAPAYVPYRPYGAYYGGYGYGSYEVARELRLLRWSVEDAQFQQRWGRFNRYGR